MALIIDTSVAIKWFVEEPGRQAALRVLQDLLIKPENFAVPELFYYELNHVFYRLFPKAKQEQVKILETLFGLDIPRYPLSMDLFPILREFQKKGLSGYDAAYMALAKSLKGTWLTFDSKAHKKIAKLGLSELLK